jgi:hypothetical protein
MAYISHFLSYRVSNNLASIARENTRSTLDRVPLCGERVKGNSLTMCQIYDDITGSTVPCKAAKGSSMRFHNEWALAAAYFITAAQVLVFVLVMPYGAATALKWSGAVLADGAVVVTTVALRSRSGNRMATLYMAALARLQASRRSYSRHLLRRLVPDFSFLPC